MNNELFSVEEQAAMDQNLRVRRQIVTEMVKDGKLPQNQEDRDFLLKAMDGSDRVILARSKIKSEDAAAKAQAGTNAIVTELLLSIGPKAKRVAALPGQRQAPEIELVTVVDETSIGVRTFSFDEVMKAGQEGRDAADLKDLN